MSQRKFKDGGFTLVELVITITLLTIVLGSLGGIYYIMQITQVRSQHYDQAVRAARAEIENLRNNGYNSLTPGSTIDFTPSLPAALPSDKKGTVSISQPLPGLVRLDVTITYTDFGLAQKAALSSDVGVIGIGQGQ